MKNKILPVIAAVILIAAFGVALYPTVSQGINQLMSESAITQYNDTVDTLSAAEKTRQLAAAEEYNHGLSERVADSFSAEAFVSDESYLRILNVTENGQIGTIDIPSIDCRLPIFHGSGEDMLTKGAVHLAGTAFPIGSDSARSVISAHTAYPGKIFFDRLTEVKIGDRFSVTVLGDTYYYKVVEINTVLPDETEYLLPEKGRDLVTLVTCTPYSVNTHRLLVTGERDRQPRTEARSVPLKQEKSNSVILSVALSVTVIAVGLIIAIRAVRRRKHEK
ncbi:sortase A [Ruminococcaceae bacterium P7]|jgi:sortase A|nr:sortase A [Ruminococcaceae bacterium P7]